MIFHGCRECRTFSGLLRFMPPAGCVKPAVFVCEWCADNDARWRYSYWCCTDAKPKFSLNDDDLDALRVHYTENPVNSGYAESRLYLEVDLQEAADAKYAAEGGLAGHRALKAARAAQRRAAADEKAKKQAERRRRLHDFVNAAHGEHAVTPELKRAALETERAHRYFSYGHADLVKVADEALLEAFISQMNSAPASAAQGASGVMPVYGGAATPPPPVAKRPRGNAPAAVDVASMRATQLAALEARGVDTGAPVVRLIGSGDHGDPIHSVDL